MMDGAEIHPFRWNIGPLFLGVRRVQFAGTHARARFLRERPGHPFAAGGIHEQAHLAFAARCVVGRFEE